MLNADRIERPAYLMIAAIPFAVAAAVLAIMVSFEWAPLMSADHSVAVSVHDAGRSAPPLVDAAKFWQYLGEPVVLTIITVCVVIFLAAIKHWVWALYVAANAILGVATAEIVKNIVQRARPVWENPFWIEHGYSFPSGHALAGIYCWVVFGIVAINLIPGKVGKWVGWILIAFGILFAPSRIVLGVHWMSDVLAGAMMGSTIVLFVSGAFLVVIRHRRRDRTGADADGVESDGT